MTTDEKNARNAEPDADTGDPRPRPGLFEKSISLGELVEQQGVGPFVWPEPCDTEDKIDADDFLKAIFGEKLRR